MGTSLVWETIKTRQEFINIYNQDTIKIFTNIPTYILDIGLHIVGSLWINKKKKNLNNAPPPFLGLDPTLTTFSVRPLASWFP